MKIGFATKIIESFRNALHSLTLPYGVDDDYEEKCNSSFAKFLERINQFLYAFFIIFSSISIYFFVTRELL